MQHCAVALIAGRVRIPSQADPHAERGRNVCDDSRATGDDQFDHSRWKERFLAEGKGLLELRHQEWCGPDAWGDGIRRDRGSSAGRKTQNLVEKSPDLTEADQRRAEGSGAAAETRGDARGVVSGCPLAFVKNISARGAVSMRLKTSLSP